MPRNSELLALIWLAALAGCAPGEVIPTPQPPRPTDILGHIPSTTIPAALPSLVPIAASPTPDRASTPVIATVDLSTCPTQVTASEWKPELLGWIVFLDSREAVVSGDRLFGLFSPSTAPVPFLSDLSPAISGPFRASSDGKWLAFIHGNSLIVATGDPQAHERIPWPTTELNYSLYEWLSDSQQLITLPVGDADKYEGFPNSIALINPFTRQWQRVEPSFSFEFPIWYWERSAINVQYSPTLDRVLYLEDAFTMTLWDNESDREVWSLKEDNLNIYPPVWSPDGAEVAFVYSASINRLRVIDRNGNPAGPDIVADGQITSFGWSPDGRYLYYWSVDEINNNLHLTAFDLVAQQKIDTCLTEPSLSSLGPTPVWSPDSQQFIAGFAINPEANFTDWRFRNVIFDLEKKRVSYLDVEHMEPVAWLIDD